MCVFEYRHTFIMSLSTIKARTRWQRISCLFLCGVCVFMSHFDVLFIGTICGAKSFPNVMLADSPPIKRLIFFVGGGVPFDNWEENI